MQVSRELRYDGRNDDLQMSRTGARTQEKARQGFGSTTVGGATQHEPCLLPMVCKPATRPWNSQKVSPLFFPFLLVASLNTLLNYFSSISSYSVIEFTREAHLPSFSRSAKVTQFKLLLMRIYPSCLFSSYFSVLPIPSHSIYVSHCLPHKANIRSVTENSPRFFNQSRPLFPHGLHL